MSSAHKTPNTPPHSTPRTDTQDTDTKNALHETAQQTVQQTVQQPLKAYRCPKTVAELANHIQTTATKTWVIMEVCGGQTNSIVRYGLDQLLAPAVRFIHGPGCPVCVTPETIITQAIELAKRPNTILCTFGDMLRVPAEHQGELQTLLTAKAQGAQVRPIYSPEEAVTLAETTPDQTIVLLAVGFETTTPATALAAISAKAKGLTNFFMLVSHVRVPPALEALIATPDHQIDAFLAAGHVCTVMGTQDYGPIATQGQLPIVVTGFEPVDILRGVLAAVQQLERHDSTLENQYTRCVSDSGNPYAQEIIHQVYETQDQAWRGLGKIPNSGWQLQPDYEQFDATQLLSPPAAPEKSPADSHVKNHSTSDLNGTLDGTLDSTLNANLNSNFNDPLNGKTTQTLGCQAGAILTGKLNPCDCPHFGTRCQPKHPLGAPMVSDEGACAAYFHHRGTRQVEPVSTHVATHVGTHVGNAHD